MKPRHPADDWYSGLCPVPQLNLEEETMRLGGHHLWGGGLGDFALL
jgi:hypothetical protein